MTNEPIGLLTEFEVRKYSYVLPRVFEKCWTSDKGGLESDKVITIEGTKLLRCLSNEEPPYLMRGVRPYIIPSEVGIDCIPCSSFDWNGQSWIVVDEDLAVARLPIFKSKFGVTSDYETSEVKKKLLDFFAKGGGKVW